MQSQPKKYVNKTYRIKGKISSTGDNMYIYETYDSCCDWSIRLCTDNTDINLGNKSGRVTILGTYKKIGGEYVLDVIGLG